MVEFDAVARFHGHVCPGLAFGYRVATCALEELGLVRAHDEELVAICENHSCAVDAIQVVTGCTAGKGNLFFREVGKQVYTLIRRESGEAVRLAVIWEPPSESEEARLAWEAFAAGSRDPQVVRRVRLRKAEKVKAILAAEPSELFRISRPAMTLPPPAQVHASLRCDVCGEKVMAPMASRRDGRLLCRPCDGVGEVVAP
ncbi:MAG: FmdE family protein [Thermodesulfobacteriota bacterium]